MIRHRTITFEFVDSVPAEREEGKLYISIKYRTAIHSCLCGCGLKVVTPLRPAKWRLIYDGDTVSLSPSVGNWSFPCRSHYWIRGSVAIPAGELSREEISAGRQHDRTAEDAYYGEGDKPALSPSQGTMKLTKHRKTGLFGWLRGRR